MPMSQGIPNPLTTPGDVNIGANKLKTTNLIIKEGDASNFYIRNLADSAYRSIIALSYTITSGGRLAVDSGNSSIQAGPNDNEYIEFKSRDNGVGFVEVARMQSAADPYFQATLGIVLLPMAQPAVPVVGRVIYNSATNKLNFWDGTAWRVVTSA